MIFRGLLSQGEITVLVVTKCWWIWSLVEGHGPHPPSPGGCRDCLLGSVGATISPRFRRLRNPAIIDPSGNKRLFNGSLYKVDLCFLRIAETSGFRGSQSVTKTCFLAPAPVLRLRRGLKIKSSLFCRAGPRTNSPLSFFVSPVTSSVFSCHYFMEGGRG